MEFPEEVGRKAMGEVRFVPSGFVGVLGAVLEEVFKLSHFGARLLEKLDMLNFHLALKSTQWVHRAVFQAMFFRSQDNEA